MSNSRGFTLIECLVALMIIAIILASASRAIALAIDDVKDSYSREAASWVAGNQYEQYHLDGVYPDLGSSKTEIKMAGLDFIVNTTIAATPNPYFRRIEIGVSKKENPTYMLFQTVDFIAQY